MWYIWIYILYNIFLLLLFQITGIILIAVGVGVASVFYGYQTVLASNFFSIPTFLIVIGVFVIFISFFGCWGAIKENYCLTLIFAILLGFIFILELAAGISGYVLRSDATNLIEQSLENTLKEYSQINENNPYTIIWDYVQNNVTISSTLLCNYVIMYICTYVTTNIINVITVRLLWCEQLHRLETIQWQFTTFLLLHSRWCCWLIQLH